MDKTYGIYIDREAEIDCFVLEARGRMFANLLDKEEFHYIPTSSKATSLMLDLCSAVLDLTERVKELENSNDKT